MDIINNPFLNLRNIFPLKLESHLKAPVCAGVYLITTQVYGVETLYYVGSSGCLNTRLSNHQIIQRLNRDVILHAIYIIPLFHKHIREYEREIIINMNPIFNTHHNSR